MHGNQHQDDQTEAGLTCCLSSGPQSPECLDVIAAVQSGHPYGSTDRGPQPASAAGSAKCTRSLSTDKADGKTGQADGNDRPFLHTDELAAVAKIVGPSSFGTWPRLVTEQDIDRVVQVTNLAYQDATYFKAREWWDRVDAAQVRTLSHAANPNSAWIAIDGPPDTPFANQIVAAFNLHDDEFLPGRVTVSMLAVDPAMHRRGLAKYCFALVWEAVRLIHARDLQLAAKSGNGDGKWTPAKVLLEVVNLQKHLLDIYGKMGFVVVGERTWDEYGVPTHYLTIPCHLVLLEKEVLDPPKDAFEDSNRT